jgi:hypothetical protein
LDLVRVVMSKLWVLGHDVGIRRVSDQDKTALREGLKYPGQEPFSDRECGLDVGEVERTLERTQLACYSSSTHTLRLMYLLWGKALQCQTIHRDKSCI